MEPEPPPLERLRQRNTAFKLQYRYVPLRNKRHPLQIHNDRNLQYFSNSAGGIGGQPADCLFWEHGQAATDCVSNWTVNRDEWRTHRQAVRWMVLYSWGHTIVVAKLRKNSSNWGKNYRENPLLAPKNLPYCTNRTFRTVRKNCAKTRYHECSAYTKKTRHTVKQIKSKHSPH